MGPPLKYYLPSRNFLQREDLTNIYEDIKKGPIYMRGENPNDNTGHAWVVDGGYLFWINLKTYTQGAKDPEPVLRSCSSEKRAFIHINWGYGGHSNGYFYDFLLNPDFAYQYDRQNEYKETGNDHSLNAYSANIKYTVVY